MIAILEWTYSDVQQNKHRTNISVRKICFYDDVDSIRLFDGIDVTVFFFFLFIILFSLLYPWYEVKRGI